MTRRVEATREVVIAAAVAGALSGAPSTLHALAGGRSPLAAVRAAGELLGRPSLVRGALVHGGISMWWTSVLALVLPRRHRVPWGTAAGLAIGGLDLSIARRRYPSIAALPVLAQLADHAAFGALVGLVLPPLQPPRSRVSAARVKSAALSAADLTTTERITGDGQLRRRG